MKVQRILHALPRPLRRHKLVQALAFIDPASRFQEIRFNRDAQAVVDLRDGPQRNVMITGIFEPEFFLIAGAFLGRGGVCFDVGANIGLCSFGLLPTCPGVELHLFEANPRLWPVLRRSMALHPGARTHLVEAAVGEKSGPVHLQVNDEHDLGLSHIGSGDGVDTRMITLDQYIRDAGVSRVDFTKMDIEGYEPYALEGARESVAAGKLPVVYFELKGPQVARFGKTAGDVVEQFRSAGYTLYYVRDQADAPVTVRTVEIAGLPATPVRRYPEDFWTDLLAVHQSAAHIAVRTSPE